MIRRILEGFFSGFPYLNSVYDRGKKKAIYYPDEIYRGDWRTIGNDIKLIIRKITGR